MDGEGKGGKCLMRRAVHEKGENCREVCYVKGYGWKGKR